jgi:hypothetical protein
MNNASPWKSAVQVIEQLLRYNFAAYRNLFKFASLQSLFGAKQKQLAPERGGPRSVGYAVLSQTTIDFTWIKRGRDDERCPVKKRLEKNLRACIEVQRIG